MTLRGVPAQGEILSCCHAEKLKGLLVCSLFMGWDDGLIVILFFWCMFDWPSAAEWDGHLSGSPAPSLSQYCGRNQHEQGLGCSQYCRHYLPDQGLGWKDQCLNKAKVRLKAGESTPSHPASSRLQAPWAPRESLLQKSWAPSPPNLNQSSPETQTVLVFGLDTQLQINTVVSMSGVNHDRSIN